MSSAKRLSIGARWYIGLVVLLGTAALGHSVYSLAVSPISYSWVLFAALTLFSGSFAIKLPSVPARISVSETFVFTAVLLYGAAPGTIIVALDGLIISLWRRDKLAHRVAFNTTEPAVSIWVAAYLFFAISGVQPLAQHATQIGPLVIPLLVFTVSYFLLNSWLTAVAVSFDTKIPTFAVWREHFLWISLNYFAGASVAILLASNTSHIDLSSLSVIVPLLVVSYLTFKTALQRIEDARQHVDKLNSLYLSTIETFALWIDAKDQVTHGHIRRVQRYALALATELGVKDKQLLRAIEAAALLHDMGKLAVPEHILNKPGKLTAGEFEKMKLHASIGAQILSSIDFPYPVVPIVRHHHENWDGAGYPDKLAGTEIPIGARILAVVDCFDALTSDRPYRAKLPDDQALDILMERRATMYDPLVVDGFVKIHEELKEELTSSDGDMGHPEVLVQGSEVMASYRKAMEVQRREEPVVTLLQLARSLVGRTRLAETAEVISQHLLELMPPCLVVLFQYRSDADDLCAICSRGVGQTAVHDFTVRLGAGISGWVGANRRPLKNCDPALELGILHLDVLTGLRNVYSVPLVAGPDLIGVLTLYSVDQAGFSDSLVRTVDLLCPHVSRAIQQAVYHEQEEKTRLTDRGRPAFELQATVADRTRFAGPFNGSRGNMPSRGPFAVVLVNVLGIPNPALQPAAREALVADVTRITRENLRSPDLLLQYTTDPDDCGLVLLLSDADQDQAAAIANRISAAFGRKMNSDGTPQAEVGVTSSYAVAPADGNTLDELLAAARKRAGCLKTTDDLRAVL